MVEWPERISRGGRAGAVGVGLAFVGLFAATSALARWHHAEQRRLARDWFAQGQRLLQGGRAAEAADAFETSLVYRRDEAEVQFQLARALLRSGHDARAHAWLSTLWQREPGLGPVNLEMARLEARRGHLDEALKHYEQALHGAWDTAGAEASRRAIRLEMAERLLAAAEPERAEAVLIPLAADPPPEPDEATRLGELLLRARAPRRALAVFREALAAAPEHARALSGAGRAAFELGDYAAASRDLQHAVRLRPTREDGARLTLAAQATALDPFRPRLSAAERTRRARAAWELARARAALCAPEDPLATRLDEVRPPSAGTALGGEALEEVMERVFEAEAGATKRCGPPAGADLALTLVARGRAERP